jgi:uncharacterized protein YaaN involved in tellurite resistance
VANFDDTPTEATPVVPNFQLTPPEVITPIEAEATLSAVPLKRETVLALDGKVAHFIDTLMSEGVHSALALGRDEISNAASLMQGRFGARHGAGIDASAASKAIADIRGQLDGLNPAHEGDLLAPNKILGIIPFGSKLKAYLGKFERANAQLQKSMGALHAARDSLQREVIDIEATRTQLWAAMQQLAAAAHFATTLEAELAGRVSTLQATDPQRAQALQQDVLLPARQSLSDILAQQAVCVNGYLVLDVLKKTGREMMNGCSRVITTIVNLLTEAGASSAEKGIGKLNEMFDQAYKAMDAMDSFCATAAEVTRQNNAVMRERVAREAGKA